MIALSPAPSTLGLASPTLSPWFSDERLTLALPNSDLSVTLTDLAADWLAPTTGFLSFRRVPANNRPADIAKLRQADGTSAFTAGHLVATFRLLPEVEARLTALTHRLPSVTSGNNANNNNTSITRQPIRYIAVELINQPATLSTLKQLVHPSIPSFSDDPSAPGSAANKEAKHLGFSLAGSNLSNETKAIRDLTRVANPLLKFSALTTTVKLWTFDTRGRAVDPGAVAAWWQYLADHVFDNLWADSDQKRTVSTTANRSVHLVNAHEGPLTEDPVLARLQTTNLTGTTTDIVRSATGADAINLSFSDSPANSNNTAPVPKLALLPSGTYGDTLSLWGSGAVGDNNGNLIERDFVRVALVDVESHLVGQRRTSTESANTPNGRRARDQNQASTRVRVAPAAPLAPFTQALLSTTDEAIDGAIATLSASGNSEVVTSVLSRDWGGLDLATLPDVAIPTSLPDFQIAALQGGPTAVEGTIDNQPVLLTMTLDAGLAGAWVRAWPQGFDPERGRHVRLTGGGAQIRTDGALSIVMTLPKGSATTAAPMGFELMIITTQGTQLFTDLRFERPTAATGNRLNWDAITADTNLILCEQGEARRKDNMDNAIASGTTLYADQTPPALLNHATIPAAAFRDDTAIRVLDNGDKLQLTQPAFAATPTSDSLTALSASGATAIQQSRNGLTRLIEAGNPIPTQERLEQVTVQPGAAATLGTTPALARYHELLPHQLGHPGAPAAPEIHGTGVAISGPGIELLAEFTRDRTSGSTPELAAAAATPLTSPTADSPNLWISALRTVAAGIEAEINPTQIASLLNSGNPYPFGQGLAAVRTWLSTAGIPGLDNLPNSVGEPADSIARALDRRFLAAARGLQEGATSLLSAIARAEDLIYLETPAIDATEFGNAGDKRSLLTTLTTRLTERPALQLILCIPIDPLPGTPKALWRVRNALFLEALQTLQATAPGRVIAFSPNAALGRTLRLSSTTVIVDQAYVLTGTTHLWRRGLTFDASIALSLFDQRLTQGRPQEIRRFSRELIAERLGLTISLLPEDPEEIASAITQLTQRNGNRLAVQTITTPDPDPTDADKAMWNRDGSDISADFDVMSWLGSAIADAQARAAIEETVSN